MREAALQYVRKVSGYRKPSRANSAIFDAAVLEIAESTRRLIESLEPGRSAQPVHPEAG